jgi:hypothetical protein
MMPDKLGAVLPARAPLVLTRPRHSALLVGLSPVLRLVVRYVVNSLPSKPKTFGFSLMKICHLFDEAV